jgi:hypothetical protein
VVITLTRNCENVHIFYRMTSRAPGTIAICQTLTITGYYTTCSMMYQTSRHYELFCVKTLYQHLSDYQTVRRYAHFNVPNPHGVTSYEPSTRLLPPTVNTTPPLLAGLACEVTGPLLRVATQGAHGTVHRRQKNCCSQPRVG